MPLFRLNRGDGGYFIDKACVVSRDPDDWDNDDVENVGVYRLQVKGPNRPGHPARAAARHRHPHGACRGARRGPAGRDRARQRADHHADGRDASALHQLEYKMAAVMQGSPYRVVKTAKGLDVPWGAEYVLEGRMLCGQRETEGPFGEFPGYYSGCHKYPVIEIDRVSHRKDPIFDSVYVGRPWTELDYLQAMTTSAPIFMQLNADVSRGRRRQRALYARPGGHRIDARCATAASPRRSACACSPRPHGLGYAKIVIVVDEDVDPFDLKQVMWAMSVKVNPAGDMVDRSRTLPRTCSIRPVQPERHRATR